MQAQQDLLLLLLRYVELGICQASDPAHAKNPKNLLLKGELWFLSLADKTNLTDMSRAACGIAQHRHQHSPEELIYIFNGTRKEG